MISVICEELDSRKPSCSEIRPSFCEGGRQRRTWAPGSGHSPWTVGPSTRAHRQPTAAPRASVSLSSSSNRHRSYLLLLRALRTHSVSGEGLAVGLLCDVTRRWCLDLKTPVALQFKFSIFVQMGLSGPAVGRNMPFLEASAVCVDQRGHQDPLVPVGNVGARPQQKSGRRCRCRMMHERFQVLI